MFDIRLRTRLDDERVIALALRAWTPNFSSMREVLGERLYLMLYPDWRTQQEKAVRDVLLDPGNRTWVAVDREGPVGFVSATLDEADRSGEIAMLAVDPDAQGNGIGRRLTETSLAWMREHGAKLAVVETAGDPSHAAARAVYASSGFTELPIARYFQVL